jgi:hypothetical protein
VGPLKIQRWGNMKSFVRRIAVVVGAAALSAGLIGATATPAHADDDGGSIVQQSRDSQWGG